MKKRKKKKKINFFSYIAFILVIVSILTIGLFYYINILPFKYFLIAVGVLLLINIIIISLLRGKKSFKKFIGLLLALLLIGVEIFGINYEVNTLEFFKQFSINNIKTESYKVVVLNDSKYKNINELKNKKIAHLELDKNDGLESALKKLEKEIKYVEKESDDISSITTDLIDKKYDAIILAETQLEILQEEDNELYQQLRVIYEIGVDIKVKDITNEVDITKKPFNVFISGIDTYGSITKVSRSDVNIIASVNPVDKKILLTSIPRDYYVVLRKYKEKDKLTHAGIYGIDISVGTLEDLLDTKINYYIKVNFSSLIKVVDALGGIEINSPYAFTSLDGFYYKKGINKLDGKRALSFVRERKSFKDGDRIRGQNQQLVLTAIINKAMSANIITKYNDLLKALEGKFITNIDDKDITKFIKNEINNKSSWNIESISLDGKDSFNYTYSYKRNKLYVMVPDEESVSNAKTKIKEIIKN